MSRRFSYRLVLGVLPLVLALCAAPSFADVHLLRKLTVGGEGGWDLLRVDPAAHRLYIPRSSHVMVLDSDSLSVVGDIPETPGVHGVALAPEAGRGFTSNGRDTSVTIFDLVTLKALQKVRVGLRPDDIAYDPATRRVFTMNAGGNDATAIDAASGQVVGTVALGGRPEACVFDGKGRMFVNLEDKSAVQEVDTRKLTAGALWPLAPGEEPTGIALDEAHGLLLSGCANQKLAVLDAASGKVVASLPIGQRVDGVAFDPGTGLGFSSNGDGTLTVVRAAKGGGYEVVTNVATEPGARTLALDPVTHRVYLVTAQMGPAPEPTADNPHPRPRMVPGTFEVLVFAE